MEIALSGKVALVTGALGAKTRGVVGRQNETGKIGVRNGAARHRRRCNLL